MWQIRGHVLNPVCQWVALSRATMMLNSTMLMPQHHAHCQGRPLSFGGEKWLDFNLGDCYSWNVITQIVTHLNKKARGGWNWQQTCLQLVRKTSLSVWVVLAFSSLTEENASVRNRRNRSVQGKISFLMSDPKCQLNLRRGKHMKTHSVMQAQYAELRSATFELSTFFRRYYYCG